jgi:hypothetical protein
VQIKHHYSVSHQKSLNVRFEKQYKNCAYNISTLLHRNVLEEKTIVREIYSLKDDMSDIYYVYKQHFFK